MNQDEIYSAWKRRLRDHPPPDGLADAVIAQLREKTPPGPVSRGWILGGLALLGAAKVASILGLLFT